MKPAPFVRHVPKTPEEALKILAEAHSVQRSQSAFWQGTGSIAPASLLTRGLRLSDDDVRYWHLADKLTKALNVRLGVKHHSRIAKCPLMTQSRHATDKA